MTQTVSLYRAEGHELGLKGTAGLISWYFRNTQPLGFMAVIYNRTIRDIKVTGTRSSYAESAVRLPLALVLNACYSYL